MCRYIDITDTGVALTNPRLAIYKTIIDMLCSNLTSPQDAIFLKTSILPKWINDIIYLFMPIFDNNFILVTIITHHKDIKKNHIFNLSSDLRDGSRGGGAPGMPPPKIRKNIIFWHKIVIFHTKYPKNFHASLHSAQFF